MESSLVDGEEETMRRMRQHSLSPGVVESSPGPSAGFGLLDLQVFEDPDL